MNSPMTMKNGMERSEKLFAPSTIWRTSTEKFVPVISALASVESSIANETGIFAASIRAKPPMRTMPASISVMRQPSFFCAASKAALSV